MPARRHEGVPHAHPGSPIHPAPHRRRPLPRRRAARSRRLQCRWSTAPAVARPTAPSERPAGAARQPRPAPTRAPQGASAPAGRRQAAVGPAVSTEAGRAAPTSSSRSPTSTRPRARYARSPTSARGCVGVHLERALRRRPGRLQHASRSACRRGPRRDHRPDREGRRRAVRATRAEDVTATYVDTEARVKSMHRERRRGPRAARPGHQPRDLVRLEDELSRRQADLDALTAQLATLKDSVPCRRPRVTLTHRRTSRRTGRDTGFLAGLAAGLDGLHHLGRRSCPRRSAPCCRSPSPRRSSLVPLVVWLRRRRRPAAARSRPARRRRRRLSGPSPRARARRSG